MRIELDKVTKIFPNRTKGQPDKVAVDNFSIEIPDGILVGLLGPSGCGKSTALNMICGIEKVTSGRIIFGDMDVTNTPPENRGVGMVFQNYALYPHLNVRQNIMFPLENLRGKDKLTKAQMEEKVNAVAKIVQIEDLMERKPNQMSGGQQQRVAIARALVKTPNILLLDEPLSNLDARLRLQTREEIRKIQQQTKVTTIFVTHDQEEAMSISDMIIVMKDGAIHQTGKPQEIYDDPVNLFVAKFLGTPQINVFEGTVCKGNVCINGEKIMTVSNVPDQDVYIGIRPEGFIPEADGCFTCTLQNVEVMGRDTSIVSTNEKSLNPTVRSIISSDTKIDRSTGIVRFNLKKHKVLLFNKETELRIRID